MNSTTPTILMVPGLREHVPNHWQTLLAAKLPRVRSVAPLEHDKLSCAARVDAIDSTLASIEGLVIIVAHSAGVMMLAHWASQRATPQIRGALLAAPADLETPMPAGYPTKDELNSHGWRSRFVELGAVGHLNPASGYGEWPQAEDFIRELSREK